ncbi:SUMO protease [Phytophthora palmivora]|uniref:SUMO protease n=1 Tax=Phytophthora palmivora TaxID=4796 RepID=A0A2P4X9N4_9STRA|nr:SUMO protease [Phytophthora palmivora]
MIERAATFKTTDLSSQINPNAKCWVLTISEIGGFTQRLLMAVKYLSSLEVVCKDGMMCYSLLMGNIDANFEKEGAKWMAKRLLQACPYQRRQGFWEGFHLDWMHYNDNFINAFTHTRVTKYENSATIKMATPASDKGKRIPPVMLSKLAGFGMHMILMLQNVNDNQWTCIVVVNSKQTIYCYDSLGKRANMNILTEIADELRLNVPRSMSDICVAGFFRRCLYSITLVHSPIQRDSDNCGLFVCLYFWRRFDKEVGTNSSNDLIRQRWDILRAVMDFSNSSKDRK